MVPDIRFPVFNSPCDPEAQPSLPSHPYVPRTTKSKSFSGVRHLSSPGRCRVLPVPRAPRGAQYPLRRQRGLRFALLCQSGVDRGRGIAIVLSLPCTG